MNYSEIKKSLFKQCVAFAEQRIADAKQAMDSAQESANQEEKSSAGDKYETGRAMAQIARDQAAQQLEEALKLKKAIDQIDRGVSPVKIGMGSLVIADKNSFYISISAGKLDVDGKEYFAISPHSPIGKLLLSRSEQEVVTFQNRQLIIQKVC